MKFRNVDGPRNHQHAVNLEYAKKEEQSRDYKMVVGDPRGILLWPGFRGVWIRGDPRRVIVSAGIRDKPGHSMCIPVSLLACGPRLLELNLPGDVGKDS